MARVINTIIVLGTFAFIAYLIKQAMNNQAVSFDTPDGSQSDYIPSFPVNYVTTIQSPTILSTSQQGRDTIANFEGSRNAAYRDVTGRWTIGVGHAITPGDGLSSSTILSDAAVLSLFASDLANAENTVHNYVKVPLTQGQFDALVDFVFNLGAGNFTGSTLLQKLNANDYNGAEKEMSRWVYAGNNVVSQLVERRIADANLFIG